MEAEGCVIPDVKNSKNTWKGRQREFWGSKDTDNGGNRVRMLAEDDYGAILKKKLHKYAHGAKEMKLELSQHMFNCDDVRVDFDKDSKIGNGIYCMNMLNQKMR